MPTDDELADVADSAYVSGEAALEVCHSGLRAVYEAGVAAATAALASERVAIVHTAASPDMETRAELVNEGFAAAMAQMAAPEGRESDAEDWLAERLAEAVAAERERCARIAEEHDHTWPNATRRIAAAIRADREPEPATEASPRPKPRNEKMVVAKIIDAVDNNTYRGAGQLLASDWLRERDAEKWDEGHAYGFYDQSENTKHSNPYRKPAPATEQEG